MRGVLGQEYRVGALRSGTDWRTVPVKAFVSTGLDVVGPSFGRGEYHLGVGANAGVVITSPADGLSIGIEDAGNRRVGEGTVVGRRALVHEHVRLPGGQVSGKPVAVAGEVDAASGGAVESHAAVGVCPAGVVVGLIFHLVP